MNTKLKLNKEVIAQLNDDSMNNVVGGANSIISMATFSLIQTVCCPERLTVGDTCNCNPTLA